MLLRDKLILVGVVILLAFALMTLLWPSFQKSINREGMTYGLDLKGGAHLVYQADLTKLPEGEDPGSAIKGIIAVIEKRVNSYGVSEPTIQKIGSDRILVQMPGVENIEEAKDLIGETALIKFKEFKAYSAETSGTPAGTEASGTPAGTGEKQSYFRVGPDGLEEVPREEAKYIAVPATGTVNGQKVELTSQYFQGKVEVRIPKSTNRSEIYFKWNKEGSDIFYDITSRLSSMPEGSVERRLGIFVGDEYQDAPNVIQPIKDDGVITGLSLSEAHHLASLLNAGRISVPLQRIEEHDVSATLGSKFIDWSRQAGIIGIALVILFMVLYYRLPGAMAGLALLIYTAVVMAAYQLIPVTMTLAGIAGFILSIGMAVDANVLIFERMREEIRMGRTLRAAVEVGFNRAWPAIRDSNISTFITCGILYWMGSSLGVPSIQGFGLTLFIGVAISMFSAIIITRTFMRVTATTGLVSNQALFISAVKPDLLSGEGR